MKVTFEDKVDIAMRMSNIRCDPRTAILIYKIIKRLKSKKKSRIKELVAINVNHRTYYEKKKREAKT